MQNKIDINNDFDTSVLCFIKTIYKMSKYDKEKMRNLFHKDVIEALMKTIDITERGIG